MHDHRISPKMFALNTQGDSSGVPIQSSLWVSVCVHHVGFFHLSVPPIFQNHVGRVYWLLCIAPRCSHGAL